MTRESETVSKTPPVLKGRPSIGRVVLPHAPEYAEEIASIGDAYTTGSTKRSQQNGLYRWRAIELLRDDARKGRWPWLLRVEEDKRGSEQPQGKPGLLMELGRYAVWLRRQGASAGYVLNALYEAADYLEKERHPVRRGQRWIRTLRDAGRRVGYLDEAAIEQAVRRALVEVGRERGIDPDDADGEWRRELYAALIRAALRHAPAENIEDLGDGLCRVLESFWAKRPETTPDEVFCALQEAGEAFADAFESGRGQPATGGADEREPG